MLQPPSTTRHAPVTKLAPGPARYTAAGAISSGCARRPRGVVSIFSCSVAGSRSDASVIAVTTTPGQIALTLIPLPAPSRAIAHVSITTAPLEAQYEARPGDATRPATDATLMI